MKILYFVTFTAGALIGFGSAYVLLKKKYDEALNASPNFVGLDIDTRPDCINESVCELISSYNDK